MQTVESTSVHRILSHGSIAGIRSAIATLRRFVGREPELTDLNSEALAIMTAKLLKDGLSRPSVNRVLRTLGALARFAHKRKLIQERIEIERVPENRPAPACWSLDQLSEVISAVRLVYGSTYWGAMLEAVLLTCYDTGARVTDVIHLPAEESGIVRFDEQKTGRRRAFVLHAQTLNAIKRARTFYNGSRDRLLPYPFVGAQPLRRRLRRALKAAGLPSGRKDLFQKIRRTTASHGKASGLDATEILGHSARWVTDTYYLDHDKQPPMDVANRLPRPK
jgi:integrase